MHRGLSSDWALLDNWLASLANPPQPPEFRRRSLSAVKFGLSVLVTVTLQFSPTTILEIWF
ncbi:hypothetical protein JOB18_009622 [Solea senegalensis]|uniref:Uncharacterized protein n=1 Tax=Solea senegalensis TaxID=28829 RepID=A0AAV6RZ65_SOLSE|nr:hypothetical protein JOB18_009622 [Solea senegalensis]